MKNRPGSVTNQGPIAKFWQAIKRDPDELSCERGILPGFFSHCSIGIHWHLRKRSFLPINWGLFIQNFKIASKFWANCQESWFYVGYPPQNEQQVRSWKVLAKGDVGFSNGIFSGANLLLVLGVLLSRVKGCRLSKKRPDSKLKYLKHQHLNLTSP